MFSSPCETTVDPLEDGRFPLPRSALRVGAARRIYYGRFDLEPFFPWLAKQRGGYALSLNGFVDDENKTVAVPKNLYDQHLQLEQRHQRYSPS